MLGVNPMVPLGGAMFEHEVRIGDVRMRVTIEAPVDLESLPLRFAVSTEGELRALVQALGGPERFHGGESFLHAFAVGEGDIPASVMIHMVGELGTDEPRPETRGQAAFRAMCAERDSEVVAGG